MEHRQTHGDTWGSVEELVVAIGGIQFLAVLLVCMAKEGYEDLADMVVARRPSQSREIKVQPVVPVVPVPVPVPVVVVVVVVDIGHLLAHWHSPSPVWWSSAD